MNAQKTVLLVDDDADFVEIGKTVLQKSGCKVITACDGAECLEKVRSQLPDLIVLDVMMPGKNGFNVFQNLKADPSTENVKIIMLTCVAEKVGIGFSSQDMGEFYGKEPDAYIEKPVEPEELRNKVLELLATSATPSK
jgi:two-component system alkaline phosphatase synthesis response regulator PhoP